MDTFQKIKAVAEANRNGFTFSILNNESPEKGFVIAMNLTQNHFGDDGLKKVIEIAKNSTFLVGGWFDEESKQFYYDCVMIEPDREKALQLGKANKQLAIFDLETKEEIRI